MAIRAPDGANKNLFGFCLPTFLFAEVIRSPAGLGLEEFSS